MQAKPNFIVLLFAKTISVFHYQLLLLRDFAPHFEVDFGPKVRFKVS